MVLSLWLLLLVGILTLIYVWMKHNYSYWKRKNVAYVEPYPIVGNLMGTLRMKLCAGETFALLYNNKKVQGQAAFGAYVFNKPALIIRDPDMAKTVFIKEFNRFTNRYASTDPHDDALAFNNLFFAKAPYWKEMRTKLTPVFTSGKLKQMFPLVEEIGCELNEYLCKLTKAQKSCVKELKEISALYSTDVIASVAYGVRANSLKDPNCEFRKNGRPIFTWTTYKALETYVIFFLPRLVRLLRVKVFSKEATKFLRSSINFVLAERAKSGIARNDLIDVLVGFKQTAEAEGKYLNPDLLVAQAALFFTAGFEPASSVISFGLHELSKKPHLQKRLRDEIKSSLMQNCGKVTYESLKEMQYLNMVVQEILRMYPPQPFIDRECTLDKNEEEFSLKPHLDFSIPNGMPIYYPVYAIQRDPKYFPNPDEFDPERFSPENKPNITPFAYLPFGVGPHSCIGGRLGYVQSKIGLINFLRSHYVEPCEQSHDKMTLEPRALLLSARGGMYVRLVLDPLIVEE